MKKLIVLAVSCFSFFGAYAQENLNNEVIDVVKDFRPKIMKANKIKSQPIFIDTTKVAENLKYAIRFEDFRAHLAIDSLVATLLERPSLERIYTKHAEVGLGTLLNPHIALDISKGRSTQSMYHAYLNYDGAHASGMDAEDHFSNIKTGATYKRVYENFDLISHLSLSKLRRHDALSNKFDFTNLGLSAEFLLADTSKAFVPNIVAVSGSMFYKDGENIEQKLKVSTIHKGQHEKFNEWNLTNSILAQQSFNYSYIHWNTKLNSKKTKDLADIQMALQFDVLDNDIFILPELRVQYQLIEKGLYAYCEFGGDRRIQEWSSIYSQNPMAYGRILTKDYTQEIPDVIGETEIDFIDAYGINSTKKYFSRVGLNGNLFRGVSYQVALEANKQNGFMHFVHMSEELNQAAEWIAPVLTELKAVGLHAELDAKWTEKFHVWLKGDYWTYNKHLSYVPDVELGLYGDYHYNDQWFVNSSIRYIGTREALHYTNGTYCYQQESENMPAVLDVNLKVSFAYQKQLSFYIEALNLLNQDFVLWQENPVLGRQLNFGLKYRF